MREGGVLSEAVLEVVSLSKTIGKKTILHDINLEIKNGEIYGLIGSNGAGKTTLFRIITGLSRYKDGDVRRHMGIGSLIEAPSFYEHWSAIKNLELVATITKVGREQIFDVLDLVGLRGREKQRVSTYSYGMKQKLGVAQALLGKPGLLILDEPTNGLDVQSVLELRQTLKKLSEKGVAILLASHQIGELELLCDQIGILHRGTIIYQGGKEELLNRHGGNKVTYLISTTNNTHAHAMLQKNSVEAILEVDKIVVKLNFKEEVRGLLRSFIEQGIDIECVQPLPKLSLEEVFSQVIKET